MRATIVISRTSSPQRGPVVERVADWTDMSESASARAGLAGREPGSADGITPQPPTSRTLDGIQFGVKSRPSPGVGPVRDRRQRLPAKLSDTECGNFGNLGNLDDPPQQVSLD